MGRAPDTGLSGKVRSSPRDLVQVSGSHRHTGLDTAAAAPLLASAWASCHPDSSEKGMQPPRPRSFGRVRSALAHVTELTFYC